MVCQGWIQDYLREGVSGGGGGGSGSGDGGSGSGGRGLNTTNVRHQKEMPIKLAFVHHTVSNYGG